MSAQPPGANSAPHQNPLAQPPGHGERGVQSSTPAVNREAQDRPRGKGLGVSSLLLGIGALLIGAALAIAFALLAGPYINQTGRSLAEQETMPNDVVLYATLIQYGFAIPSLLGLAAIVLGIIAMVTKRGRALGVVGMIIALIAPVLCIALTVILIIFAV